MNENLAACGKHDTCAFDKSRSYGWCFLDLWLLGASHSMVSFTAIGVFFLLVSTNRQNPDLFCWKPVFGILLRDSLSTCIFATVSVIITLRLKVSAKFSSTNI